MGWKTDLAVGSIVLILACLLALSIMVGTGWLTMRVLTIFGITAEKTLLNYFLIGLLISWVTYESPSSHKPIKIEGVTAKKDDTNQRFEK